MCTSSCESCLVCTSLILFDKYMLHDTKCQNILIPTLGNILEDSAIFFVKKFSTTMHMLEDSQSYYCFGKLPSNNSFLEPKEQ